MVLAELKIAHRSGAWGRHGRPAAVNSPRRLFGSIMWAFFKAFSKLLGRVTTSRCFEWPLQSVPTDALLAQKINGHAPPRRILLNSVCLTRFVIARKRKRPRKSKSILPLAASGLLRSQNDDARFCCFEIDSYRSSTLLPTTTAILRHAPDLIRASHQIFVGKRAFEGKGWNTG